MAHVQVSPTGAAKGLRARLVTGSQLPGHLEQSGWLVFETMKPNNEPSNPPSTVNAMSPEEIDAMVEKMLEEDFGLAPGPIPATNPPRKKRTDTIAGKAPKESASAEDYLVGLCGTPRGNLTGFPLFERQRVEVASADGIVTGEIERILTDGDAFILWQYANSACDSFAKHSFFFIHEVTITNAETPESGDFGIHETFTPSGNLSGSALFVGQRVKVASEDGLFSGVISLVTGNGESFIIDTNNGGFQVFHLRLVTVESDDEKTKAPSSSHQEELAYELAVYPPSISNPVELGNSTEEVDFQSQGNLTGSSLFVGQRIVVDCSEGRFIGKVGDLKSRGDSEPVAVRNGAIRLWPDASPGISKVFVVAQATITPGSDE